MSDTNLTVEDLQRAAGLLMKDIQSNFDAKFVEGLHLDLSRGLSIPVDYLKIPFDAARSTAESSANAWRDITSDLWSVAVKMPTSFPLLVTACDSSDIVIPPANPALERARGKMDRAYVNAKRALARKDLRRAKYWASVGSAWFDRAAAPFYRL